MMAAAVRERAARLPDAAELAGMTASALTEHGSEMSAEEIRRLAAAAITLAEQVARQLSKLASLLDEPSGDARA